MTEEIHYKSAASRWFHQIPDDWHISKLKFLVNIFTGNSLNDGEKLRFSFDENPELKGYNYISSKDIDVGTRMCNYDTGIIIPTSETKYKVAPSNSTLLCIEGGSAGKKITFTTEDVCFVNKLACFKSTETTHPKFVYYFLQSNEFKNQFQSSLSGLIGGVSLTNLNDFEIPFPPLSEQTKIADFLDQKTAQIDTIIEKKQKLLQLLDEKKKSVINEAVTKGLNPNVPMKDSGIEWIGDIPESWEVKDLKYLTDKVGSGITPRGGAEVYQEDGIKFIRSQNVYFEGLRLNDVVFIDENTHTLMSNSKVYLNDVLLNITGGSIGRSCVVTIDEEFNVNQHVCILRSNDKLLPEYLNYFLFADVGQTQIRLGITGGNREGLNFENLRNFKLPYTKIEEQQKIVDFLNIQVNNTLNIVDKINSQIEKLREYRQSIISEAVTGKLKI